MLSSRILASYSAAESIDPDAESVSLLLHMDGSDGSNSFVDSSPSPKTVTAQGSAKISSTQSKFGGASGFFIDKNSYIVVPSSTDFDFPGDFTIELNAYKTSTSLFSGTLITRRSQNNVGIGSFRMNTFGFEQLQNPSMLMQWTDIPLNQWTHIAVQRKTGVLFAFMNGVLVAQAASTFNFTSTYNIIIGADNDNNGFFGGYIDEVRITKGVARYAGNFTPPTAPFPNP